MTIIIIIYILSIPVSFFILVALTANYRSYVNSNNIEHSNPKIYSITNILYVKEHRHSLTVWGVGAFLPVVNIGIIIMFSLISIVDSRVGLPTPCAILFRRLFRTQRLLDRVSEEI